MNPFEWLLIVSTFVTMVATMTVVNICILVASLKLYTEFFKQIVQNRR